MLRITPYENYDLFDMFRGIEKEFVKCEPTDKVVKIDVRDEGDKYVVEADMPGINKEDIHIDIDGDKLLLKASRSYKKDDETDNYVFRERSYGTYQRTFNVKNIDVDSIGANYSDGVLTIDMPKRQEAIAANRRIEIK